MNYKAYKPEKGFPGRMITSGCGSSKERLSSWCEYHLKTLMKKLPYRLEDTSHFLQKLIEYNNTSATQEDKPKMILCPWDIEAMSHQDHKEDFPNTIKCKVINPACNNLGKVSKRVLDNINTACRKAAGVNQWKSTQEVLCWLSDKHANNPIKSKGRFGQFDICEFYPSISEELLGKSLTYAITHAKIEDEEVDLIMACRRSILFNNGKTWTKKNKNFDVTMGAQDGAEIAELTGIFLLKQVDNFLSSLREKAHAELYRDDGLIYIENANGPLLNKIEKATSDF